MPGLFGGRRSISSPVKAAGDDRFRGLTPVERAMAEQLGRPAHIA
jgi:hypothetical protein